MFVMLETTLQFAPDNNCCSINLWIFVVLVEILYENRFRLFHFLNKGNILFLFFYGWILYENGCAVEDDMFNSHLNPPHPLPWTHPATHGWRNLSNSYVALVGRGDHPNPPLFLHGNKYRSCQTRPTGSFYPGLLAPRDRISAARTGTKENCRPRSCGVFRKRAVLKQEYTAVPPHTTRHMVHRRRFLGTPFLLVNVLFYNIRCYWWLTFGSPRLPAQYAPRIVLTQGWKESKTKSHYRKRSSV
jgi:hypothetical protein